MTLLTPARYAAPLSDAASCLGCRLRERRFQLAAEGVELDEQLFVALVELLEGFAGG